jgi:oxygen-dependent protoporphyrinogen oxidase
VDPYLVVGGGVSGIAAAHYLQQAGVPVALIEQDEALGGRVAPAQLAGQPIELGGKNIGRRYSHFRAFARLTGDPQFEPFGLQSSRVLDDGRLVTVDGARRWRSVLGLLRSCPFLDLVRFGRLAWRVKQVEAEGYLGGPSFTALGARRDHRPLSAWFSEQFADTLLRPLSLRMNGAEPDEVYLGNLGTNLRTLLDSYDQPRHGMRPIFDEFARQVPVQLGVRARGLVVRGGRIVAVETEGRGGQREERPCAGVVLATPAGATATLLAPHLARTAQALRAVRYFPVLVVVARYARPVFTPQRRALVFGAQHALSNAGAYGLGALDVVRYTFSGRAARQALAAGADGAALLAQGEALLTSTVGLRPGDRLAFVSRRFDPGLCAYAPHHGQLAQELTAGMQALQRLALTGDYVRGASIEACFRASRAAVDRLLAGAEPIFRSVGAKGGPLWPPGPIYAALPPPANRKEPS